MSDSSIWPIDRTLSNATTSGLSGLESDDNKGVLHNAPELLKPHHQIV